MSALLVAYDLNAPGQKHTELLKKIKEFPWAKISESAYAIGTQQTASQVYKTLKPIIDDNDNLFVIPLHKPYDGWGPKDVHEWLGNHLGTCR